MKSGQRAIMEDGPIAKKYINHNTGHLLCPSVKMRSIQLDVPAALFKAFTPSRHSYFKQDGNFFDFITQ